jgi:hypothetical protein
MSIEVKALDGERSPIVGIALVAVPQADKSTSASVQVGEQIIEVPLRFYKGSLNLVRTELHSLVSEAIDTLME